MVARSRALPLRKIIAYVMIVALLAGFSVWVWLRQRRERIEKERRHGPRPD